MNKIRDIDLMQFADGELEVAARPDVEATLAADPDARARLEGVAELGELVRTHLELSADDVERRLGAMWTEIDKRLDLAADAARAIPATATPAAAGPGLWGRLTRWLDAYRGHILTGTLSAGAVAAIALMLRPGSEPGPRTSAPPDRGTAVAMPSAGGTDGGVGDPGLVPVAEPAQPIEVDSLDVEGGSGTVFTVEDDDGAETTVIWLTDDTVEGI